MKKFFEKIKYKLCGIGTVAIVAWFGALLARLPKLFERVPCLTGWEAIGVFMACAFLGLLLLASLAFFAYLLSVVFEDTFKVTEGEGV